MSPGLQGQRSNVAKVDLDVFFGMSTEWIRAWQHGQSVGTLELDPACFGISKSSEAVLLLFPSSGARSFLKFCLVGIASRAES